jgi:serine/threonine protein kinase
LCQKNSINFERNFFIIFERYSFKKWILFSQNCDNKFQKWTKSLYFKNKYFILQEISSGVGYRYSKVIEYNPYRTLLLKKFLFSELNETEINELIRDVKIASNIQHIHVLPIIEYYLDSNSLSIIYPFAFTFYEARYEFFLNPNIQPSLNCFFSIMFDALLVLHSHGIVYKSLNIHNIFCSGDVRMNWLFGV